MSTPHERLPKTTEGWLALAAERDKLLSFYEEIVAKCGDDRVLDRLTEALAAIGRMEAQLLASGKKVLELTSARTDQEMSREGQLGCALAECIQKLEDCKSGVCISAIQRVIKRAESVLCPQPAKETPP